MSLDYEQFTNSLRELERLNERVDKLLEKTNLPFRDVVRSDHWGMKYLFGFRIKESMSDNELMDIIVSIPTEAMSELSLCCYSIKPEEWDRMIANGNKKAKAKSMLMYQEWNNKKMIFDFEYFYEKCLNIDPESIEIAEYQKFIDDITMANEMARSPFWNKLEKVLIEDSFKYKSMFFDFEYKNNIAAIKSVLLVCIGESIRYLTLEVSARGYCLCECTPTTHSNYGNISSYNEFKEKVLNIIANDC